MLRQKRLREARAQLEICSRDVCPRVARSDCRTWLAGMAEIQPSIVIAAHEVRGARARDIPSVRLIIDDTVVVPRTDSRPIDIDPGPHRLRFERPGAPLLEEEIDVVEGEKGRVIDVTWQAPEAPPPATTPAPPAGPASAPVPSSVYVLGALGLGALGAGTYFEVAGLSKRSQLDDSCRGTHTCAASDVDTARNLTRAGDATLGAGALLLLGAGIIYFTRSPSTPAEPEREGDVACAFQVQAAPGGFIAGIRGAL